MVRWIAPLVLNPEQPDDSGASPVHIASANGHANTVDLLAREFQHDVNLPANGGWLPVTVASQYNQLAVLKVLVANGADIDGASRDRHRTRARLKLSARTKRIGSGSGSSQNPAWAGASEAASDANVLAGRVSLADGNNQLHRVLIRSDLDAAVASAEAAFGDVLNMDAAWAVAAVFSVAAHHIPDLLEAEAALAAPRKSCSSLSCATV